jgi:hypothetical protein
VQVETMHTNQTTGHVFNASLAHVSAHLQPLPGLPAVRIPRGYDRITDDFKEDSKIGHQLPCSLGSEHTRAAVRKQNLND